MQTKTTNGHAKQKKNDTITEMLAKGTAAAPPAKELSLNPEDYLPTMIAIPLTIAGVSDLIVNNFNEKTRQQILDKHKGNKKEQGRAPKDVDALFQGSKYVDEKGRDCIHAAGLRNAMISAARGLQGVTMTELKQAIFIEGPEGPHQTLIPIEFQRCYKREDAVRNETGVADIRVRAAYEGWSCKFNLVVLENIITPVQALQLVALAGTSAGLHEWRPSGKRGMGGPFGRFKIASIEKPSA